MTFLASVRKSASFALARETPAPRKTGHFLRHGQQAIRPEYPVRCHGTSLTPLPIDVAGPETADVTFVVDDRANCNMIWRLPTVERSEIGRNQ
jgi:hypothetical protein